MEVRDQEQRVVEHEVGRGHGEQHAGHAADDEGDDERDHPHHRHVEPDAPRYIVNIQLKIFAPVGIEMIIVVIPKNEFTSAPEPMVKKWCSHTR